jgi:hypothetical protein
MVTFELYGTRGEMGVRVRGTDPVEWVIPHPYQWMLTSDQDFDAFTGLVQTEDVYNNATIAFRCPQCDRLHVYWRGIEGDATAYAPE